MIKIKIIATSVLLMTLIVSCSKGFNSTNRGPVFVIPENYRGPIFMADDKGKKGQVINGILVVFYSHDKAYREKKYGPINFRIDNETSLLVKKAVAGLYLDKQYDQEELALWEGSITKFGAGSEDLIKKIGYGESFFLYYYGTAKDAEAFFLNENSNKRSALIKLAGIEN